MKTAKDYPVTFGYKAYDGKYYTFFNRHKGEDRPTPTGTPIKVGKKIIGYTGNTGLSSGPHLHTDKYIALSRNWLSGLRKYFKPVGSFTVEGRVVFAGNLGTAGNCVIIKRKTSRLRPQRVFYRYLHLSKINVKKGDWVK